MLLAAICYPFYILVYAARYAVEHVHWMAFNCTTAEGNYSVTTRSIAFILQALGWIWVLIDRTLQVLEYTVVVPDLLPEFIPVYPVSHFPLVPDYDY